MIPAGNKAKHLSSVNHTIKTIHHHHVAIIQNIYFVVKKYVWKFRSRQTETLRGTVPCKQIPAWIKRRSDITRFSYHQQLISLYWLKSNRFFYNYTLFFAFHLSFHIDNNSIFILVYLNLNVTNKKVNKKLRFISIQSMKIPSSISNTSFKYF